MVLLAQLDDQVPRGRLLGLVLGTVSSGKKEGGLGCSAEMMTEDVERIEGVSKSARHLFGGTALDQESAQGLVLAVFGQERFQKKAPELT
jgi:hypothetical protein